MNAKSPKGSIQSRYSAATTGLKNFTKKPLTPFAYSACVIALILLILGIIFGIINRANVSVEITKNIAEEKLSSEEPSIKIGGGDKTTGDRDTDITLGGGDKTTGDRDTDITLGGGDTTTAPGSQPRAGTSSSESEEQERIKAQLIKEIDELNKTLEKIKEEKSPPSNSFQSGSAEQEKLIAQLKKEIVQLKQEVQDLKEQLLNLGSLPSSPSSSDSGDTTTAPGSQPRAGTSSSESAQQTPGSSGSAPSSPIQSESAEEQIEELQEIKEELEEELFDYELEDIKDAKSIDDFSPSTIRILEETFRNGFTARAEIGYPLKADLDDIEGRCVLSFDVSNEGKAENIESNCFKKEKYFEANSKKFIEDSEFVVPDDLSRKIGVSIKYMKT